MIGKMARGMCLLRTLLALRGLMATVPKKSAGIWVRRCRVIEVTYWGSLFKPAPPLAKPTPA